MRRSQKVAGGVVALLVIGGAGGAIAATQLDSPSAQSALIVTDAANQLGVTPTALSNALQKAEEDQIDAEVSSGQLTQSQGTNLKSAIESGALPLVTTPGLRHGGVGIGMLRIGPFGDLSAAATFLGLTAQQIQTDLQNGQTLAQIATAQGKQPTDLVTTLVTAAKTTLDAAASAGKLSSDQETSILSALQTQITNVVNGTGPSFGGGAWLGHGPGGPGGSFGFRIGFVGGADLSAAATYLGLSTSQIQTDLQNGETLAQIATSHGKQPSDLVTALVAADKAKLDTAVSNSTLSSGHEAQILSMAETMITNMVNGTRPSFGGMHSGGMGFGRFRGASPAPGAGSSGGTPPPSTTPS
jgi:hypothetical protein